jgi:hypothetical protein
VWREELSWHDREHQEEVQTVTAPRALLAEIVDYAGVFPPAALDLEAAVRAYGEYSVDDASWMLGRFVAPAARLEEALNAWRNTRRTETLHIAVVLGSDPIMDLARIHQFNATQPTVAIVDCAEAKLSTPEAIRSAADAAGSLELFVELPPSDDPQTLIETVAAAGASAKIRTGGVTPEAFPPASSIVRFMRRCLDAGVRFKATAGLHHPLRAEYRLTYEEGAACSSMCGFLNVFLAAAALKAGISEADGVRLLNEGRRDAFAWSSDAVAWEGCMFTAGELRALREFGAVSFGSCSFREPVDESRALGLIE